MSPRYPRYRTAYDGGPRASGDEPGKGTQRAENPTWSPRERG